MNRAEASQLVAVLLAAYPAQAERIPSLETTAEVYEQFLSDLDYAEADRAVRALIAESKWLPTVAEIRDRVAEEAVGANAPELAWEEVLRQVRRVGSYGTPTFSDPCTERAVASLGWRAICDSRSDDWTRRAQFIRAYQAAVDMSKRAENTERLLESLDRRRLAGVHDLPEGELAPEAPKSVGRLLEGVPGLQRDDGGSR